MAAFQMNNLGYALQAYCQMLARLMYGADKLPYRGSYSPTKMQAGYSSFEG